MSLYVAGQSQNAVTSIPHQLLFNGWKRRLDALELQAIDMALDHLVQTSGGSEIRTARWLSREVSPLGQHDWEGSPFMRIWDKACNRDRVQTGWCFALFLWQHMLQRPEAWHFKTMDLDDVPMAGTRYYRSPRARRLESRDPALAAS
jgi:hypothetical protein